MTHDRYRAIALYLIDLVPGDLDSRAEFVAKYLEQLANAAMEHVYELDGSSFLQDVISSFAPPLPGKE